MGQRDDLLAGARQCLIEKGYAHTTARDIVAVTGANLASIGYHFGTKDALLNAAVMETFTEWGSSIEGAAAFLPGTTPESRLEAFLTGLLATAPEQRSMMVASTQALAQAEFAPDVREQLAATFVKVRSDLAAMVLGVAPDVVTQEQARTTGSLALTLINGAMSQWLVDAAAAPRAGELVEAIRSLAGSSPRG
ncbi:MULTISPECIES: TetR/AcrR family transcriptional regulator [Actinoalloteichus]|uniref:Transcriptional regulator, TetR family n=1 Tax=Actinoalloteichus fjordicus TaxID=1612552 RepID=A0AAC9PQN2_9PSEU|nr:MULTISPECIES: TetR/AcrR family transcriptional regulator [Actinoalloteichus]APU13208.1 transcriptional regulator, TetR family [Actinoalloteichus fjordicus]APU19159.1 transcriptional regulator, TetR family [Actinoalloteichus sp. GBA129-24]